MALGPPRIAVEDCAFNIKNSAYNDFNKVQLSTVLIL